MKRYTVYIPYHQKLNELCDFVFQTANALLLKGYVVKMILFDYAYFFGDPYARENFSIEFKKLLKHPQFSVIRPLVQITPRNGLRRLHKLNQEVFFQLVIKKLDRSKNNILWVYWPEDIDLVKCVKKQNKNTLCVYDCVDNFTSVNLELDQVIKHQENSLIKISDHVFVNSSSLYSLKKVVRKDLVIVPQGFDQSSFKDRFKRESMGSVQFLKNIPHPIVGYCGSFTYRIDYELLYGLISKMPNISFVFIGPVKIFPYEQEENKTRGLIRKLGSFHNSYVLPAFKNKSEMACVLDYFDIGMIPYDTNLEFNRYSYPMKLFEYFCMGKPVISTPIEELKRFTKYVKIGSTAKEWERQIETILFNHWTKKSQEGQRTLAKANSWEKKVEKILSFID
ncbi:hypothetical protein HY947_04165 [Candidatus Gottesmanbacteria bacterium]|nr:hypothetical protein [Candidatus Gottesmanbacteria bacterium]